MPDYSKGKIYKIISNSTKYFYIGSTTVELSNRMAKHKIESKRNPDRKVYKAFNEIGWDDLKIIKIIDTPDCKTKEDLTQQEQKYIDELKNEWCLNHFKAWTGLNNKDYDKDYYKQNKDKIIKQTKSYYENNKEEISKKNKEYREKNKETILERTKQYREKNKDEISRKNKIYRDENRDEIKERDRLFYAENKEKLTKKRREYYENNKDDITERRKKIIHCLICNCNFRIGELSHHNKTMKHIINFIQY